MSSSRFAYSSQQREEHSKWLRLPPMHNDFTCLYALRELESQAETYGARWQGERSFFSSYALEQWSKNVSQRPDLLKMHKGATRSCLTKLADKHYVSKWEVPKGNSRWFYFAINEKGRHRLEKFYSENRLSLGLSLTPMGHVDSKVLRRLSSSSETSINASKQVPSPPKTQGSESKSEEWKRKLALAIKRALDAGTIGTNDATTLRAIVDELEPMELEIVAVLDDPILWARSASITYPPSGTTTISELVQIAIPGLRDKPDQCNLSLKRLRIKGLILARSNRVVETPHLLINSMTSLGRQLARLVRRVNGIE